MYSLFGDIDLTGINGGGDILRALAIDSAAEGDAGSEDLLDGALELDGHALGAKLLGDVDDVSELEVAVVLHVLLLLSVAGTLLKSLDNERGGSGEHGDEALSVLHHHFDLDLNSAPVSSGLLDVFTDLLGGHTKGTALGGQSGGRRDLTSDDFEVHYTQQPSGIRNRKIKGPVSGQLKGRVSTYRTSSHQR